jgi:hypothetical protein
MELLSPVADPFRGFQTTTGNEVVVATTDTTDDVSHLFNLGLFIYSTTLFADDDRRERDHRSYDDRPRYEERPRYDDRPPREARDYPPRDAAPRDAPRGGYEDRRGGGGGGYNDRPRY